jgi:hypothetical protein
VGIKKITIAPTRYDYETIIPFFCAAYQKAYPFAKHP